MKLIEIKKQFIVGYVENMQNRTKNNKIKKYVYFVIAKY